MAVFTSYRHGHFTEAGFQRYFDGNLRSVSSTEIIFDGQDTATIKSIFSGSFQTSATGKVTGTITDFIVYYGSTSYTFATIEGANVSVDRVLSLIARDKYDQLGAEFASGDDLVDGRQAYSDFVDLPPLYGHDGNDTILGATYNDTMYGGQGRDELRAGSGDDVLFGGSGSDQMYGDFGNDTLAGDSGADMLNGGYGEDALNGGGGRDKLLGGSEKDVLSGGAGRDKLLGQGGADTLNGGAGDDVMSGNGGADDFIFKNGFGKDIIKDFNATNNAEDIDLRGVSQIKNFNDLKNNHMERDGSDVIITQGNNSITLEDVRMNDLGNADFLF